MSYRRLTISFISTSQIVQLEVPSEITILDLKALIASELPTVPTNTQHLYHNGRLLAEQSKSLQEYGVANDDLIVLHSRGPGGSSGQQQQQQQVGAVRRSPGAASGARGSPYGQRPAQPRQTQGGQDPELIRLQVLGDPRLLGQLRDSQPDLAASVNDPERFAETFQRMEQQRAEADRQKQREIVSFGGSKLEEKFANSINHSKC